MDDLTEKWGTELTPEIEVDFETKFIQLKTDSEVNQWRVVFRNNMGNNVGNVKVDISEMKFHIEACEKDDRVISPDLVLAGDDDICCIVFLDIDIVSDDNLTDPTKRPQLLRKQYC